MNTSVSRGAVAQAVVVAGAVAAAFLPTPPEVIERLYSTGAFLAAQARLTAVSNRVPLALSDVLVAALGLAVVAGAVRALRQGWIGGLARMARRGATWAAVIYLVFLATWGLNYRRQPLRAKLRFEPSAVTPEAARTLAVRAASELSTLYAPAHEAGWATEGMPSAVLSASFAATIRQLGVPRPVVVGRPKTTMLDLYFHRAGVDGMTDPFFLETLVATDLRPFERPFVIAHEWSHLAGFADEGDANFVGWLTCLHASPGDRYSGWLFLFDEIARNLRAEDRAAVADALGPGPRDDLRAIAARLQRQVSPRVSAAGWRVYDSYLKANRVDEGAASYGQVVRLALGVQFADGWVPLRN